MDVDLSIDKKGKVTYRISEQTASTESMVANGDASTNHYLTRIPQTVDPTMLNIWGLNQSSFISAAKLSASNNDNASSGQSNHIMDHRLIRNDPPKKTIGSYGNQKIEMTQSLGTNHVTKSIGNIENLNVNNSDRGQGDASSSNVRSSKPSSPVPDKTETEPSKRCTDFASRHKNVTAKSKLDSDRSNIAYSNRESKSKERNDSPRYLCEMFADKMGTGSVTFKSSSSKDWVVRTSVLGGGTTVHRADEPSPLGNEQSMSKTQTETAKLVGKLDSMNLNSELWEPVKSIEAPAAKESTNLSNVQILSQSACLESTKIDTHETRSSNSVQCRNGPNNIANRSVSSAYMSQRTLELCKNDPYLASLLFKASKAVENEGKTRKDSSEISVVKTNQKDLCVAESKKLQKSVDSNQITRISPPKSDVRASKDNNSVTPKRRSNRSLHTNTETIFDHVNWEDYGQRHTEVKTEVQTSKVQNSETVDQDLKLEQVDISKTENFVDDGPLTYRPIGRTVANLLRDSVESCEEEKQEDHLTSVEEKTKEAKAQHESQIEENGNQEYLELIAKKREHYLDNFPMPKTPCSSGRKVTFRDRISSDSSNFSDSVYGIPKRKQNEKRLEDGSPSKAEASGKVLSSLSKNEERLIAQAAVIGKSIKASQGKRGSDSSDGEFEKFWNVSLEEWKKLSPYQKYLKYKRMTSAQKDEMYVNSVYKLGLLDSDNDPVALVSKENNLRSAARKVDSKRGIKLLYPKKSKKEQNNLSSRAVPVSCKSGKSILQSPKKGSKQVIVKVVGRNSAGSSKKTMLQDTDDDDGMANRNKETFRSGSFEKLVEGFLFSSEAKKSQIDDDVLDTRLAPSNSKTAVKTDSTFPNDVDAKTKLSPTLNERAVSNGNDSKNSEKIVEKSSKEVAQNELPTEREETPAWSEPFPDSLILETYRPEDEIDDGLNEDMKMNETNVSLSTFMPETRRSISKAFKQLPAENDVDVNETTENDQFSEFVFLCRNNALSTRCETALEDAEADTVNIESDEIVLNEQINGNLESEATSCDSLIDSLYGEPHVKITPLRYIGSHAKKHLESEKVLETATRMASNSLPDDGLTFKQFLIGEESTRNDRHTLEDLDEFVVSKFGGQTVRDMTERGLVSRSLLLESVDAEGQTTCVQGNYIQPHFAQPRIFKRVTEDNKEGAGKSSSDRKITKEEHKRSSRSPNQSRRARSSSRSPRGSNAKANVSAVQNRNPHTRFVHVARGSASKGANEKRKPGVPQNAGAGTLGNKQQGLNDKVNNAGHAANIASQLQRSFPQSITKQSRVAEEVSGVVAASNAVTVKEAPKIHKKTAYNTPSPQLYPTESGLGVSAVDQPLANGFKPNLRNKHLSPQLVRPSSARQKRKRVSKEVEANNRLQATDTPSRSMSPDVNSRSYNSSRSPSPKTNVAGDSMPPSSFLSGKPITREEHFSQYLQELHASLAHRNTLTTSPTMLSSASTREICGDLLATPKGTNEPSINMWLTLPTEMWLYIMSFLEPHDLNYLGLTCKKLKSLAFDFTLWSSVTVSKKTLQPLHLKSILSLNPTCVSFLQCDFDGIKDENLREFFRSLRGSLQELNIVGCNSKECNANSILVHAGTRCPKMINLDTSWSNLNPHTLVAFSEYVDSLESLSLNGCSAINDDCINKLMEKYGKSLKKIYLYGCYKLDLSLKSMSNVLQNLRVIHLGNVPLVTDDILHKFATSLRDLREVDVRSNKNITDEGIYNLAFYCRRLMVLIIPNCPQISNYALYHLGGYCMNLSVLDLDGCSKISDDGVEKLICGTHVIIQKLGLSSTGITSASCKMVEENCAKLQEIKFSFCHAKVSVDALKSLVESKPTLSTIHLYGFDETRVKKALKGVNKNLKINI